MYNASRRLLFSRAVGLVPANCDCLAITMTIGVFLQHEGQRKTAYGKIRTLGEIEKTKIKWRAAHNRWAMGASSAWPLQTIRVFLSAMRADMHLLFTNLLQLSSSTINLALPKQTYQ